MNNFTSPGLPGRGFLSSAFRYRGKSDSPNLLPLRHSLVILLLLIGITSGLKAQELPPPGDCVANDFELRGAELTGIPSCFDCKSGESVPANLELVLYNKTGSTRTAFAFWATLETTDSEGNVIRREEISSCGGPVEGDSPAITFDNLIRYECGTTLRITNIYMAWTSASPNETCDVIDRSLIAPKCTTVQSFEIGTPFTVGLSDVTDVSCYGEDDGAIDLRPSGGDEPYTFVWTMNENPGFSFSGEDPSGLAPGTYNVEVTDANGCVDDYTGIVIEEPAPFEAELIEVTDLPCSGSPEGAINISVGGGRAPYSYEWSNGATTEDVEGLEAGTYSVTVTDSSGCTVSIENIGIIEPVTPTANAGSDVEITCERQEVTLTGVGNSENEDSELTYTWTGPDNYSSSEAEVLVIVPGIYTLRVTDSDNGCFAEDTVEVSQDITEPVANAGADVELTCENQEITLSGTGSSDNQDADLTYSWTGPNDYSATDATITVALPGSYILRVTDNDNGCYAEDTVEVGEDMTAPTANAGSDTELTCETQKVTLTGLGESDNEDADLAYEWTGPNNFNSTEVAITVSVPGTYTLRVTDRENGCYAQDTVEVGEDTTAPTADAGSDTELTCERQEVTLAGVGHSENEDSELTYAWKGPDGYSSTDAEITVNVPGIYTFRVTDSNNGCYAEDTVAVGQDITAPIADAGADVEITCTEGNVTLTGVGTSENEDANLQYSWIGPGDFASSDAEIIVSTAGAYTLRVTDLDNGCFDEDTVEVGENTDRPIANAGSDVELTCLLEEVTLKGVASSDNDTADLEYLWTGPDGFTSSNLQIPVDVPGEYTFRVTDRDNGCFAEDSVEVGQDIEQPIANAGSDAELTCLAEEVTLTGAGTSDNENADLTYEWSGPGEFSSTSAEITVSIAGTYIFRVTDSDNGCYAEDTVEVGQDNEQPVANAGADMELTCEVNEVTLIGSGSSDNVDANLQYEWTGPNEFSSTEAEITVSLAGIYTLRVTDKDNGCYAEDSVEVEQNTDRPTANAGADTELTCKVTEVTLTGTGSSESAVAELEYEWTGPEGFSVTGTEITVSVPGTYTLRVTDIENGCYAEDSVEVGEDTEQPVASAGSDVELTCLIKELTLTGTGTSDNENADLTHEWSGPGEFSSTSAEITVSVAGIYTFRVIDNDNGCYAEDIVMVGQDITAPVAEAGADVQITCTAGSVTLTGAGTSDNEDANLQYSWSGPVDFASSDAEITVSTAGSYTLRVTDLDNGCFDEDTVAVGENTDRPAASAGSDVELTCFMEEVTLTGVASSNNDTADLEYLWTGPDGFTSFNLQITVDVPGEYTFRVTDNDNGCFAEDSVEVGQDIEQPVANAGPDVELTCLVEEVKLTGSGSSDNVDADLSYNWTGPGEFSSTSAEITVNVPGTYTLRVTDSDNGCYAEDTVEVGQDTEQPIANAGADAELTCEVNEITLTGIGSSDNADANLVYEWTGPNEFSSTDAEITLTVAGTYTLTVTDNDNGCYAEDTVEVGQNTDRPTANAGTDTELTCELTQVTLIGIGDSNNEDASLMYEWAGPDGYTATEAEIVVTVPGTYTLRVTDQENGCYAEDSVVVGEDTEQPIANAGPDAELTCLIEEVKLTGSGSSNNLDADLSYNWTGPGEFSSTSTEITVNVPGTYTLRVTDSDSGCYAEDTVEVGQDITSPVADAGADVEITCTAGSVTLTGGTSDNEDANLQYSWSGPGDFASSDAEIIVSTAGSYTLRVTDLDNGCFNEDTVAVGENTDRPAANAGSDVEITCVLEEVTLTGVASSDNDTADLEYLWTGPDGFTSSNLQINVDVPGEYTFRVTDNVNGCFAEDSVEVGQDTVQPIANAGPDVELTCLVEEVTLTGVGASDHPEANLDYLWTGPEGFTSSNLEITVGVPGEYTFKVTDTDNGCYAEDTVMVGQDITAPVAEAGADVEITCTAGSVTLTGAGTSDNEDANLQYSWSGPGDFASSDAEIIVSTAGSYTLRVTDPDNGCFDEDTVEVGENTDRPAANAGSDVELTCFMEEVTLTGVASSNNDTADLEYLWTGPDGFTSFNLQITVDVPGEYTFRVTDNDNGCFAEDSVEVGQDTVQPIANAGPDVELTCLIEEVTLTGVGASDIPEANLDYLWTGPEGFTSSNLEITVGVPGEYTFKVTDAANGCYAEDTVMVGQDITAPVADAGSGGELTCEVNSIQLNGTGSSTNPDAVLVYSWTGPGDYTSSEEDPEVTIPGTYTLRVTDPVNGCYAEDAVTITEDQNFPGGNIDVQHVSCPGEADGSISVTVTSGTPPFTVNGETVGADNIYVMTGLSPGLYGVTIAGANGCAVVYDDIEIKDAEEWEAPVVVVEQPTCDEPSASVVITSETEGLLFSLNGGGFVAYPENGYEDLDAGSYSLIARSEAGCTSDAIEFTVNEPLDIPSTPVLEVVQPTCDILTGTILVTSGTDGLWFSLNGAEFVPYPAGGFTNLDPGTYTVQVQSADECISGSVRVTLYEAKDCDVAEGCTLGYWKNHTDRWCGEYQTCMEYGEVFAGAPVELASLTLLEVLNLGGGGIYNLGRQSVAALLNACSEEVDYEIETTGEVIDYVITNFANAGQAGSYLDMLNNAGCTLGGSRATTAPSEACEEETDNGNNGNNGNNGKGNSYEADITASFNAYPVPFTESVNLSYQFEYTSDVVIHFYDMKGRLLKTVTDTNVSKGSTTTIPVDFAIKANQMYVVKVITGEGEYVKQIISSKK